MTQRARLIRATNIILRRAYLQRRALLAFHGKDLANASGGEERAAAGEAGIEREREETTLLDYFSILANKADEDEVERSLSLSGTGLEDELSSVSTSGHRRHSLAQTMSLSTGGSYNREPSSKSQSKSHSALHDESEGGGAGENTPEKNGGNGNNENGNGGIGVLNHSVGSSNGGNHHNSNNLDIIIDYVQNTLTRQRWRPTNISDSSHSANNGDPPSVTVSPTPSVSFPNYSSNPSNCNDDEKKTKKQDELKDIHKVC